MNSIHCWSTYINTDELVGNFQSRTKQRTEPHKIPTQKFEKMRWLIFLLFVCVNLLAFTEADPQFENPYYYQNYPAAYQNPENYPYFLEISKFGKENRLFFGVTSLFLTTTTSTSTSTISCSVSTSSVCSGRRRRFLVDALRGEDDNIEPSPVNKLVLAFTTGVINFLIDWWQCYWISNSNSQFKINSN